MAVARLILLGILFTEVLKPACAEGLKGVGSGLRGKHGIKSESSEIALARSSGVAFVVEPPKGDVIIGRRGATLACSAGTNNVTWLQNGALAPPCGVAKCTLLHNGSLHIHKKKNSQILQKHRAQDTNEFSEIKDEYRCIARTSFGGLLRSSPTFVRFAEITRGFKESPKDARVREGETARFACFIKSVPLITNITWLHNERKLKIDTNDTRYFVIPPGVLYINSVRLSDAGSYRCLAYNEYLNKTKTSKEAQLTVLSKYDDVKDVNPTVLFPQTSYYYSLLNGSSIHLACAASGFPAQGTVWSFVPRQSDVAQPHILLNSTSSINVLKLKNINVSDAGYYLCSLANNNVNYQNITIDVLIPPSFEIKPTNQICPNGRTVRFECQAQGIPTPRIYWFKDAENITIKGRRTVYEREFNKFELAISATVPSDSGVYQCVAVNAAGQIWAAGRLQVNTSRNSPAALTSLKCRAISPVRMFISWEPPKFLSHSSITAYTVHYSPVDGGKEEVSPPEPGNSTSVEVTKLLEPFTNYSFYVRVWNNHGASNQSATIVCATAPSIPKAAPKIKVDVIGSTKLNITWKPLTKAEAQGIIVEYKLQWRPHQSPAFRIQLLSANVEHFLLKDLIPGEQYDIRVLARTKQGWPNVTESQLKWTSVKMPLSKDDDFDLENILQLEVDSVNKTAVNITWEMKEDSHNFISEMFDSWEIYCENKNGEWILSFVLVKNTSEYLLQYLDPNEEYTVGLCMRNRNIIVGCLMKPVKSTHSSLSNVPAALEATPATANSIHLRWTPSDSKSKIIYEVCYHAVHKTADSPKCTNVTNNEITVNKLKPFTLYQFKVRTTGNNSTPFSETIECYSKEDVPGKVEGVQWSFISTNTTSVRVIWKEPSKINGVIQKYLVSYTTDLTDSSNWTSIEINGNDTYANLPTLLSSRRYYVMVQAATRAGFGKRSDPVSIMTSGGASSKISTSLNNEKPAATAKPDQSLGIILGVGISIVFITICLCSMYCRRKCEASQLLRQSAQVRKLPRETNGCCLERASTSTSQHNVSINNKSANEIELAVLCPQHVDTKGSANGIAEPFIKEPLLIPWQSNGGVRITECPELGQSEMTSAAESSETSEQNFDSTQLTLVNCSLRTSNGSLNNNLACAMSEVALEKVSHPAPVPILGPNG